MNRKPNIGIFAEIELTQPHDPSTYWERNHVADKDFLRCVVAAANLTDAGKKFQRQSLFTFTEESGNVWSATDASAWIAVKIEKQPKGEPGEFRTDGYALKLLVLGVDRNIFAVHVRYRARRKRPAWIVDAWERAPGQDVGERFVTAPRLSRKRKSGTH